MTSAYFQHTDVSNENDFLKVVQLLYIDDSDPSLILYHFDDGTKCNKDFIGAVDINPEHINTCAYVRVKSPIYKWTCKKTELKTQTRQAKTASGEIVEIPDMYMTRHDGGVINDTVKYEFTPPVNANLKLADLNIFYLSYIIDALRNQHYNLIYPEILEKIPQGIISNNLLNAYYNRNNNIIVEEDNSVEPLMEETKMHVSEVQQPATASINIPVELPETLKINSDKCREIIIGSESHEDVHISYHDGIPGISTIDYWIPLDKMIAYAESWQEYKDKYDNIIKDNVDDTTYKFLYDMIKNSIKKEATAGVEITLAVPPFEVYKLLKTAYPEDWAKIFISIIAKSVSVEELQNALAAGLEGYYDAEIDNGTHK